MGVLDIIVRLVDQFEIIALPVGMLSVLKYKNSESPSTSSIFEQVLSLG